MAEQYLSDFAKPSINSNVARRILANEVLRGVTQDVIETNGEGVTQRFSNDVSGAQIRIVQFMPFNQEARELGAQLNGENFDGRTALQANTNGLGVDVITVINQNIDIPQVTQDMLPIDILGNVMKNLEMDINNNINAMTIGGKLVASLNDVVKGGDEIITIAPSTADGNDWRLALLNMNAKLDEGDIANGIAYFPKDDRCFVIKASFVPYLLNGGIFSLGGANHAYEMLAKGGISPSAVVTDMRKGFVGEFDGVPVYKSAGLIWNLAAKYAGVPAWALDKVYGYVSSGYANVRALAQEDQIKIIDSPDGAGVRIQPNFRMGFKSLYAKGNVFLVDETFSNPAESSALTLKAPASRTAYSTDTSLSVLTVGGQAGVLGNDGVTYTVAGVNDGSDVAVVATATAGVKALVEAPAAVDIVVGTNTFFVTVIAENGAKKKYKVVATGV